MAQNKEKEKEEEEEEDMVASTSGIRNFQRYKIHEDPPLISFQEYMTSVVGKSNSETQAAQIARDVSKFLCFACGNDPIPKWEQLLDKDMLLAYVQKLERYSIGADGKTQKLDALDAAV